MAAQQRKQPPIFASGGRATTFCDLASHKVSEPALDGGTAKEHAAARQAAELAALQQHRDLRQMKTAAIYESGSGDTLVMANMWREDRYREILRTREKDQLLTRIWREAYAEEYPEDAEPFGFATVSDLEAIAAELHLTNESKLLDVGCGRGGPGLWIARKTGCAVVGLDILAEAIEQASSLKERMGVSRARFAIGTFGDTGQPSGSYDTVMSVDAFWMVLDKPAAIREMARIIRPGGRIAMTTWVSRQEELEDMFRSGGFCLLSSCETPRWKERQMAVYRGILRNREELERQVGAVAAGILVMEAREAPGRLAGAPRRLLIAERQL